MVSKKDLLQQIKELEAEVARLNTRLTVALVPVAPRPGLGYWQCFSCGAYWPTGESHSCGSTSVPVLGGTAHILEKLTG